MYTLRDFGLDYKSKFKFVNKSIKRKAWQRLAFNTRSTKEITDVYKDDVCKDVDPNNIERTVDARTKINDRRVAFMGNIVVPPINSRPITRTKRINPRLMPKRGDSGKQYFKTTASTTTVENGVTVTHAVPKNSSFEIFFKK
jgi:hypothetical protein